MYYLAIVPMYLSSRHLPTNMFKYHLHFASRKINFATEIISKYKHQINHYLHIKSNWWSWYITDTTSGNATMSDAKKVTYSFRNNVSKFPCRILEELKLGGNGKWTSETIETILLTVFLKILLKAFLKTWVHFFSNKTS